jgi:hypothetical protein
MRALTPALSNISAQLDTPLEIRQTDAVELRTGATQTRIITAPKFVALAIPPTLNMSVEYRACASLYREATISPSLRYRFLCYYKIIDGIYARRRRTGKITRVPEKLPLTLSDREAWLKAIFAPPLEIDEFILENTFPTEILGKKLTAVIEHNLQPIRLRIAHAVLSSGELVVSPDEPEEEREIIKWLPLTKCAARRLLKNEFPTEFLSYLGEDGSVHT